jgi:hypothetical protein
LVRAVHKFQNVGMLFLFLIRCGKRGTKKWFIVWTSCNKLSALISKVRYASVSFVKKTLTFLPHIFVSAALYEVANEMSAVRNILFFFYHSGLLSFIHGTKIAHSRHVCNYVHMKTTLYRICVLTCVFSVSNSLSFQAASVV